MYQRRNIIPETEYTPPGVCSLFNDSIMMGASGGQAAPVTIVNTDNAYIVAGLTTFTFSAKALGTAAANRKIVITTSGAESTRTVSALTVAGISAAWVMRVTNAGDTTEVWQADVPTGTTGDVVVTWTAGQNSCSIGVFAVYGAASAAHDTASSTAATPSASIDIPAGGVVLGEVMSRAGTNTWTWTNLTENYDEIYNVSSSHSGGSDAYATVQTGLTITATPSGTAFDSCLALVSWGPA